MRGPVQPKAPPPFGAGLESALAAGAIAVGALAAAQARGAVLGYSGPAAALACPFAGATRSAFALLATAWGFVRGSRQPPVVKAALHPVLFTAAAALAAVKTLSVASGLPFRALLEAYTAKASGGVPGAGAALLFLLGPSILSFSAEMFRQRHVMAARAAEVAGATAVASAGGLLGTAALARGIGLSPALRLSTVTRQITSPLAMACAGLLGADPSLAVALVVVTGLLGSNFGAALLDAAGFKGKAAARGLAMGAAAHGLGTAALAADPGEADAFAFSAVSMALVGTATTALVSAPAVRAAIRRVAGL